MQCLNMTTHIILLSPLRFSGETVHLFSFLFPRAVLQTMAGTTYEKKGQTTLPVLICPV